MWQSAALVGALTLAGSVPVVFGTACWARPPVSPSVPVTAAAAAAVKRARRPMAWSIIGFLLYLIARFCECTPIRSRQQDQRSQAKSAALPLYSRRPIRYSPCTTPDPAHGGGGVRASPVRQGSDDSKIQCRYADHHFRRLRVSRSARGAGAGEAAVSRPRRGAAPGPRR